MSAAVLDIHAGIEGGGTNTVAILLDGKGHEVSRANGEGSNPYLVGIDGSIERIHSLLTDAKRVAGLDHEAPVASLGLALSGGGIHAADDTAFLKRFGEIYPKECATPITLCEDTVGSLYTAASQGGVVLIAGTGSNCELMNPDGNRHKCGGWGHMIGDQGSAFWISQKAITLIFALDDGLEKSSLCHNRAKELFMKHFNLTKKEDMLKHLYGAEFSKGFVASFCRVLASACLPQPENGTRKNGTQEEKPVEGDPFCMALFQEAGVVLARHVVAILPKADPKLFTTSSKGIRIVCVGSVWKAWKLLKRGFEETLGSEVTSEVLKSKIPDATRIPLTLVLVEDTAAVGASTFGARQAGYTLHLDHGQFTRTLQKYEFLRKPESEDEYILSAL